MICKRYWKTLDIEHAIKMRRNGFKLLTIGLVFNVTPNAIRKMLMRYDPIYIKIKPRNINIEPQYVSYEYIKTWAKNHNLIKTNQTPAQIFMEVNILRKKQKLNLFKLRD